MRTRDIGRHIHHGVWIIARDGFGCLQGPVTSGGLRIIMPVVRVCYGIGSVNAQHVLGAEYMVVAITRASF